MHSAWMIYLSASKQPPHALAHQHIDAYAAAGVKGIYIKRNLDSNEDFICTGSPRMCIYRLYMRIELLS